MTKSNLKQDAFKAIADGNRRKILELLSAREMPVTALLSHFNISQPALSQHLKVLRDSGLVQQRRKGREQIYSISPEPLKDIMNWAQQYERFWNEKLDALGKHLYQKHGDASIVTKELHSAK